MRLQILQLGESVLRKRAKALSVEEILSDEIQSLIQRMVETMRGAPGVGLAAPQIGRAIQLAVIEDREEYHQLLSEEAFMERKRVPVPLHVIINPTITKRSSEAVEFFEGCLSFSNVLGIVPRALSVRVECLNEKAEPQVIEATGWYARILQHEIDHLHGTVCVDHMLPRSIMTMDNYQRYWQDKSIAEVKKL